jgi:hypothetical protein
MNNDMKMTTLDTIPKSLKDLLNVDVVASGDATTIASLSLWRP